MHTSEGPWARAQKRDIRFCERPKVASFDLNHDCCEGASAHPQNREGYVTVCGPFLKDLYVHKHDKELGNLKLDDYLYFGALFQVRRLLEDKFGLLFEKLDLGEEDSEEDTEYDQYDVCTLLDALPFVGKVDGKEAVWLGCTGIDIDESWVMLTVSDALTPIVFQDMLKSLRNLKFYTLDVVHHKEMQFDDIQLNTETKEPLFTFRVCTGFEEQHTKISTKMSLVESATSLTIGSAVVTCCENGEMNLGGPTIELFEIAREWRGFGLAGLFYRLLEEFLADMFPTVYPFEMRVQCTYVTNINAAEFFVAQGFRDNDGMLEELIKEVRTVNGRLLSHYGHFP